MSTREDNIYYARLAEQGERYEDMIRYMKEVANVSKHIHCDKMPRHKKIKYNYYYNLWGY